MMALAATLRGSAAVRAYSSVNCIALGSRINGTVVRLSLIRLMCNSSDVSGVAVGQESSAGKKIKLKSREKRFQQRELLRQNRSNPVLEKEARTGQLFIPLSEIKSHWQQFRGIEHLQTMGYHFNIYSHVYGLDFRPRGFITVTYPGEQEVHHGNIITAEQASLQPTVTLPSELIRGYSTLVLSNPDGHLNDYSQEVLHWMVTNIPGDNVQAGNTVCPYLQPVPPKGTGFHRYVFSLYTHQNPLSDVPSLNEGNTWLEHRTFSTQHFLSSRPELRPFTFSIFQCQWDHSVHNTYMNTLMYPEPVYSIEKPPNLRQLRNKEIREKRSSRYRHM